MYEYYRSGTTTIRFDVKKVDDSYGTPRGTCHIVDYEIIKIEVVRYDDVLNEDVDYTKSYSESQLDKYKEEAYDWFMDRYVRRVG